jgi:hypothetical protein
MKYNRSMLYMAAGVSLFVGFIIVSIGIGAIFPSMHRLAAPLICRGEVKVEVDKYSIRPGETYWENHIYCYKTEGGVDEITFPAIGMTGLAASASIFVVLAYRWRDTLIAQKDFNAPAIDFNSRKTAISPSQEGCGAFSSQIEWN